MKVPYSKFINFIWYQAVWFLAILGGYSYGWALALLLLVHLAMCKDWKTEAKIMVSCASLGVALDSIFALQGLYQFDQSSTLLPVPFWLAAIWLGFIGTLRHSLSYMLNKPLLMTVASGIAAPLSYLAGMRLGAVEFPYQTSLTLMCISLVWMAMMPIFIRICLYFQANAQNGNSTNVQLKPTLLTIGAKNESLTTR